MKKLKNFFFVPFRPALTPFIGPPSPGPKLSFFLPKNIRVKNSVIDNLVKQGMSSTRYIQDQQTYDTLAKGLPYNSIRNGHQQSLEKYAHGRLSRAEG
jgi:hypothetical protein